MDQLTPEARPVACVLADIGLVGSAGKRESINGAAHITYGIGRTVRSVRYGNNFLAALVYTGGAGPTAGAAGALPKRRSICAELTHHRVSEPTRELWPTTCRTAYIDAY